MLLLLLSYFLFLDILPLSILLLFFFLISVLYFIFVSSLFLLYSTFFLVVLVLFAVFAFLPFSSVSHFFVEKGRAFSGLLVENPVIREELVARLLLRLRLVDGVLHL